MRADLDQLSRDSKKSTSAEVWQRALKRACEELSTHRAVQSKNSDDACWPLCAQDRGQPTTGLQIQTAQCQLDAAGFNNSRSSSLSLSNHQLHIIKMASAQISKKRKVRHRHYEALSLSAQICSVLCVVGSELHRHTTSMTARMQYTMRHSTAQRSGLISIEKVVRG